MIDVSIGFFFQFYHSFFLLFRRFSLLKVFLEPKVPATKRGIVGFPGYKETVDFGEYIGVWISEDGLTRLPTTRGTIHYGKEGALILYLLD